MDVDAAGNTVAYMVPNYQIDGKTGTWLPYDSEVVEGVCFFMMRNEQRKDAVSPVVVDSKGVFIMWRLSFLTTKKRETFM